MIDWFLLSLRGLLVISLFVPPAVVDLEDLVHGLGSNSHLGRGPLLLVVDSVTMSLGGNDTGAGHLDCGHLCRRFVSIKLGTVDDVEGGRVNDDQAAATGGKADWGTTQVDQKRRTLRVILKGPSEAGEENNTVTDDTAEMLSNGCHAGGQ